MSTITSAPENTGARRYGHLPAQYMDFNMLRSTCRELRGLTIDINSRVCQVVTDRNELRNMQAETQALVSGTWALHLIEAHFQVISRVGSHKWTSMSKGTPAPVVYLSATAVWRCRQTPCSTSNMNFTTRCVCTLRTFLYSFCPTCIVQFQTVFAPQGQSIC